jgi:cobalt-zinc-cadmium efflux system membrane fusion protein
MSHPLDSPASPSRRIAIGSGVAMSALVFVGWLCLRGGPEAAVPPPTMRVDDDAVALTENAPQWRYLELAVAEEKPMLAPPPAPARVVFDETRSAAAGSPLPGRVERVEVRLGDQVHAGDRLFTVRSGALADLGHDIDSARSDVAAKTRIASRARELVALRAAPEKDALEAEEAVRQAELALHAATAKRESLGATIQDDTRFEVTAPQDGTVVELDVSAGQSVGPDRDHPCVRLSNVDEVLVLADLQEEDAYDLQAGAPVTIHTPAGDVERAGVVERVSQVVDPQRHTVEVRVRASNADHVLRPNAFVEVSLATDPTRRRVRVPAEAVVSDGKQMVVFVTREAGHLERVPVTTGRRRDGEVELLSGLAAGTRYVQRGGLLLLNEIALAH